MGFTGFIYHLCFLRHVVMVTKIVESKITHMKDVRGQLELTEPLLNYSVSTDNVYKQRDQQSNKNI